MDGDEDKFAVIPLPASPRISLGKRNHATAAHATVLVALLRRMPFILLYHVNDDDVFHYLNVFQLISLILTGIHKFCVVFFFPRSRLAIIPQDAFLFSGGVRNNLDPWRKVNFRSKKKTL